MALRKYHIDKLVDPNWIDHDIEIDPFSLGILDNGTVHISSLDEKGKGAYVQLSFDQIDQLYGKIHPQQTYDCDGNKTDSWATLTEEQREVLYSHFPNLDPKNIL